MSILIKGIDMPKECEGIELVFIPKDEDIIYNRSESMSIGADRIIEIPTPHGRLIDADKLKMECYHTMEELAESTTMNISAEALSLLCGFTMIGEAPTILEEEP